MYKKLKLVESTRLNEKLNSFEKNTFSKKILDAKTDEDIKKIVYEIKPYSEPTYTKCMEILNGDGSTQYKAGQISDILYQLNESEKLKEDSTEEYWDATEITRDGFMSLMKFNFGTDSKGNNYIITVDANDVKRFGATSDDEAIEIYNRFKENWDNSDHADLTMDVKSIAPRNESAKLTEADEDLEDIQDDVKEDLENQEELEDTVDSEEDQEENPVEEESELDTQLNELRDILVDLDLNLYQITDKEDLNNSVYIIGKVAEDSDEVLMLVDTKPEEVNSEEIPEEEPIIDKIDIDNADIDNDLEESALKESKENKLTWEQFEEAMTNASKEGKEIKGVIVFSPKSFDKEYSEESRSYRVSSNNKYWDGSKLGSSLFGYCLDGTDQGARLDWYMKAVPEDNLGKRWIVDYCYLEDNKIEEKMNGFNSINSEAEELFTSLQDVENIDTEKWNNSTDEERIEMVKPILTKFYKENKDKINNNWHDFMELLEYWNYHTEYKIFKGLKNNINEAEEIDLENNEESEEDEHKTELEQRFDFVKLPNTFEEINKLNPRYGEELTPDHESIVEYLMNCLIEKNPEAAEELQNSKEDEETPTVPEEDIDLDIDINGEEDLDNEDQY